MLVLCNCLLGNVFRLFRAVIKGLFYTKNAFFCTEFQHFRPNFQYIFPLFWYQAGGIHASSL